MSEAITAALTAAGAAAGVIGKSLIDRYRNRDRLDSAQASAMINKLWRQNEQLSRKVDECQEHHRECEVRATALEGDVRGLRKDVDELKQRLQRADLLE